MLLWIMCRSHQLHTGNISRIILTKCSPFLFDGKWRFCFSKWRSLFARISLWFIFQNWSFLAYNMFLLFTFFTTHIYRCEKGWCISASQWETSLQAGCSDAECWGLVPLILFQLSKSENESKEARIGGWGWGVALTGNWGVLLIHLSVWRKTW